MKRSVPALKPREVLKALERAGFVIARTSGSHLVLKHRTNVALRVTLAMHNKDLKRRTLESVIKQSGLSNEEFLKFL